MSKFEARVVATLEAAKGIGRDKTFLLDLADVLLESYLGNATVWHDGMHFIGNTPDNDAVIIGDTLDQVKSYLTAYPRPSDW